MSGTCSTHCVCHRIWGYHVEVQIIVDQGTTWIKANQNRSDADLGGGRRRKPTVSIPLLVANSDPSFSTSSSCKEFSSLTLGPGQAGEGVAQHK